MTYGSQRRTFRKNELDRRTWASNTTVVLTYDTVGSGAFLTEELMFGVRFSGPPYVSQGQELIEVGSLIEGDYPHVTVGVAEWVTKSAGEAFDNRGAVPEHIGAKLWIAVSSATPYAIRHNLVFDGLAMKTPLVER